MTSPSMNTKDQDRLKRIARKAEAKIGLALEVKRRREAMGISLRELARRTDISPSTLSRLERGYGMPSADHLYSLSIALDTTIANLMGEQDPTYDPHALAAEIKECMEWLNVFLGRGIAQLQRLEVALQKQQDMLAGKE